jgi:flagellin-like hook-associated protein FlgL
MESDVNGFKNISDSLSLGEATVGVARQAAETVTDLLTKMKGKIVASQEANVDRGKIQTDIVALRDQIASVVGAAQFNGLNLVDGSTASMSVLSSLDRNATGVTASSITVNGASLEIGGYTAKAAFATAGTGTTASQDAQASTSTRRPTTRSRSTRPRASPRATASPCASATSRRATPSRPPTRRPRRPPTSSRWASRRPSRPWASRA